AGPGRIPEPALMRLVEAVLPQSWVTAKKYVAPLCCFAIRRGQAVHAVRQRRSGGGARMLSTGRAGVLAHLPAVVAAVLLAARKPLAQFWGIRVHVAPRRRVHEFEPVAGDLLWSVGRGVPDPLI